MWFGLPCLNPDDDLYDEEEDENDALVAMAEDLGDWEASRYHDLLSST